MIVGLPILLYTSYVLYDRSESAFWFFGGGVVAYL